jgi:hypothetical protein
MIYDIIIIGSGISGLYAAHQIRKQRPELTLCILEKEKKQGLGGRATNVPFYGSEIATGAGIGRSQKDRLLKRLAKELHVDIHPFRSIAQYSLFAPVDVRAILRYLIKHQNEQERDKDKDQEIKTKTFRSFAKPLLGPAVYTRFLLTTGYTDYQDASAKETLFHYGMEDNAGSLEAFGIHWGHLIHKLADNQTVNFSQTVDRIQQENIEKEKEKDKDKDKDKENQNQNQNLVITTKQGRVYRAKHVIVATTISSLRHLFPHHSVYRQIESQPFLRVYAKFDKKSLAHLNDAVPTGHQIVKGPLQKIISIDKEKGVYMIAYSDNQNAERLHSFCENTESNRSFFGRLVEQALGLEAESVHVRAITSFFWQEGTHYYRPNKKEQNKQHPLPSVLVVGEAVSRHQGWVEGALESVDEVVTKSWIRSL